MLITLTSCKNLPPRLEAPIMDAEAADMNAEAPADWLGGPGVPYTSITLLCKSSLRIVDAHVSCIYKSVCLFTSRVALSTWPEA